MNHLADAFALHRKAVAWTVILLTAAAAAAIGRLDIDQEPRTLFRQNDADFALLEELFADFGPDDNDVVVLLEGDDLFAAGPLDVVRRIVERAAKTEGVEGVESILSARRVGKRIQPLVPRSSADDERIARARREALAHPAIAGQLLSSDGRAMLILVRIAGDALSISQVRPVVNRLHEVLAECVAGTGLRASLTGHPAIRVECLANSRRELLAITTLSALVSIAIGVVLFRRVAAVAVSILGPAVGVVWTVALMAVGGEGLNGVNAVLPGLLLVIGFSGAVHMVMDIRRSLALGADGPAAAADAIRHLGVPCGLAAITTMAGFGSLATAQTDVIRHFGIASACGVGVVYLSTIAVIPLLASSRLGKWLMPADAGSARDRRNRWSRWIVLLRRPRWLAVAGTVATLVMAWSVCDLRCDVRWTEMLPAGSQVARATRCCDEAFGGSLLAYVRVGWPRTLDLGSDEVIDVTRKVHALFEEEPETRGPFSVLNLLESLSGPDRLPADFVSELDRLPPDVLGRFVRPDRCRLVVTAHVPDAGAAVLEPAFRRLDRGLDDLQRLHPGFRLELTGSAVVAARNVRGMIGDLGRSVALTAALVFAIIVLGCRSLRLGLISIIPNAFPLLLVASILVWTGRPLQVASVMTFSLCLGLAVDGTIHFLMGYRRELPAGGDAGGAVERTLARVGTAVVVASLVMIGGFAAISVTTIPAIRMFALLSAVSVLAALFADLLLTPALLLSLAPSSPNEECEVCGQRDKGHRRTSALAALLPLGGGARLRESDVE